MNYVVAEKYSSMNEHAKLLVNQMKELQEKCLYMRLKYIYKFTLILIINITDLSYLPYLQKIDEIDASLIEFEKTVALLDDYTQKLGKFIVYNILNRLFY